MKICIYEPEPRICGPDTWADNLRWGFRELGHECHILAFTKSGKASPAWGRVEPDKSSSLSCAMTVDRCEKQVNAGDVLDEYDLIVLTDLKTATRDNEALKDLMTDHPFYLDALRNTDTKWTSAMHGRWYFAAPDPVPEGLQEKSGSPFLNELLDTHNFSGFLLSHAKDFDRYSTRLQKIRRRVCPLPYRLKQNEFRAEQKTMSNRWQISTIGRMIPTKHRHVVIEAMTRGHLPQTAYHIGGGCVCTHGPSESYLTYEQMIQRGWKGEWLGGVRKTQPFETCLSQHDCWVKYHGAYMDPLTVLQHAKVHVGITDCDFSGGLLEFSTLEAIDCGCMPVIAQDFVPHCGTGVKLWTVDHPFRKFTAKVAASWDDSLFAHIGMQVRAAHNAWSSELVRYNRNAIAAENDPRMHARVLIEECL